MTEPTIIRRPYGPRYRVPTRVEGESLTHQSFKDACDINNIVSQYVRTGVAPGTQKQPRYLDCTNVTNYYDAMLQIQGAHDAFESLPTKVREHFDNDPESLLEAFQDPSRREELQELGIISKGVEEPAPPAPQAPSTPATTGKESPPPRRGLTSHRPRCSTGFT